MIILGLLQGAIYIFTYKDFRLATMKVTINSTDSRNERLQIKIGKQNYS